MPIYEYQCIKCGYIFEKIEMGNATELSVKCPECNDIIKKIISSSNFIIKGYSEANNYSKEKK